MLSEYKIVFRMNYCFNLEMRINETFIYFDVHNIT